MGDLPSDEKPRERLMRHGASVLSNSELLAVLLRCGTRYENVLQMSRRILGECGNSLSVLRGMEPGQLCAFGGIGPEKASTLAAAFELAARSNREGHENGAVIRGAKDVEALMAPLIAHLNHEECWAIYLNKGNKVVSYERISSGGMGATVVDSRIIIRHAISKGATAFVLVHNHPSGNASPGEADIRQTQRLMEAASTCDISLLDHVVISRCGSFSFLENGVLK